MKSFAHKHNVKTFAGLDDDARPAFACERCAPKLAVVTHRGLVTNRKYDFLQPGKRSASSYSNAELEAAIGAMQRAIDNSDERVVRMERHGGFNQQIQSVNILDTAWKSDDRKWFEAHPDRSHRVRMPYPNETPKTIIAPAGYELILMLRQVEPGSRVKCGGFLKREILPVPDIEAIAHAFFDLFISSDDQPISKAQVEALVARYLSTGGRRS